MLAEFPDVPGTHGDDDVSRFCDLFQIHRHIFLILNIVRFLVTILFCCVHDQFTGVYRRWEKKGEANGIVVYDDYAHHPTECKATLSGVKSGWRRRVVCVFQPHLYSRTRDFYEEFGKAFLLADVLVLTDVYPAREEPIQGITGELIVNAAKQYGHKEAHYVQDKKNVPTYLKKITKAGDIVITMGAGDIWKFGEQFLNEMK